MKLFPLGIERQSLDATATVDRCEFIRLGLTDAALIECASEDVALVTTDFDLYQSALAAGAQAYNFNHIRESYLNE
jgi:hypothetical protein